jgi:hypothetical protein
MSSSEKHVNNILNEYKNLISQNIEPYQAIRQIMSHTHKKAFILNILERDYNVSWTMKSRFLSMKKDFRNAFLVGYFTDNLHPCPVCGESTPHISTHCCKECSNRDIKSIKKRTIKTAETKRNKPHKVTPTYFQIHGHKYTPTKEHVEKIRKTTRERYGVDNILALPEIRSKSKAICLEKYGCESPFGNRRVFEKARQTCREKFGTDYYSQSQDWKNKKGDSYIYPTQEHITHFEDYNENFIRKHFIRDGVYYITEYMEYFNKSYTGAIHHKHKLGIVEKNNINHATVMENELKAFIEQYTEVIEHDRMLVKPKEIDLVIPAIKLGIEYNGLFWHSEQQGKTSNYHVDKTDKCEEQGYQLLHIFENEGVEIWKSVIINKFGLSKKIYARKTELRELKYCQIKDFLVENHIQGEAKSSINYGLFYNNELVQVMTFAKPRFNKNYDYELVRLCSKKFTSVVGGASKLFKHFIMQHSGASIISYANRRFSMGRIYKTLGFELKEITKPNYFYSKHGEVYSRYQTQKHKLPELLGDGYDKNLTERENMLNNKFLVVYDCGNLVYTYKGKTI